MLRKIRITQSVGALLLIVLLALDVNIQIAVLTGVLAPPVVLMLVALARRMPGMLNRR